MLGAALIHALWNLALADAEDTHAATAVALATGMLVLAPFALAFGSVSSSVWPWAMGSAALELAYFGLLASAYSRAELSVVYPLSRGLAPVLVLIASVALLSADVSAAQAVGVAGVGAGVLLVRDLRGRPDPSDVLLALGIACAIAGYTLVDNEGVEHADALAYLALVLAPPALVYLGMMLRLRPAAVRAQLRAPVVFAGVGMVAAYGLVLAALELAPAAPVAAVRESSVLIATALAGRMLAEEVGPKRLAGAALIVAGIAAIALG
ncbi:MAG: EamA family transporter [Thermoleophilaceae bacterium]